MSVPDFTKPPYQVTISPRFPDFPTDTFAEKYKSVSVTPEVMYSIQQARLMADLDTFKDFCAGVKRSYIEESIHSEQTNLIVTIERIISPQRLLGFALVRLYKDTFEIDVICSAKEVKGVGTELIRITKHIGQLFGQKTLTLNSVTEALGFYMKLGFECNDLCPMKVDISDVWPGEETAGGRRKIKGRKKRHTTRRRTLKANRKTRHKRTYRR